jgi:cytochrome c553
MRQTTIACLRRAGAIALLGGVVGCTSASYGTADEHTTAAATAGNCPQPRTTERAPDSYIARVNPLPATAEHLERGRQLYERTAKPDCQGCHGVNGDGNGPAAAGLEPPARNFTCTVTMATITDGQLYWVIERGSGDFHLPSRQGAQQIERPARGRPTTAMRGYGDQLTATDIWQLVLYLRIFAATPTSPDDADSSTEKARTMTTPENPR